MDKKPLILVSICAVVLLVLGSLSNVVGYQTIQSSKISPNVYLINVRLWKLTKDGYFIYNVTNLGNQTIENATMFVRIQGGAHFHGYVDVNTSISIEYLPCLPGKNWQLYQTIDPIFTRQQYPIFHRPLIGTVIEEEKFMNDTQRAIVHILFAFAIERFN